MFLCGVCGTCVCVCEVFVCVCVSCMAVCRLVKHMYLYMDFVAHLDHHNSKIKMFREKRLHLKDSPDTNLLIKPLPKKMESVVKVKNHFEN